MPKVCCEKIEKAIKSVDSIKMESPSETHERLDGVKALLQELLENHIQEAGEASWES